RMPERGPHVSGATRLLQLRHEQSAVERALSSTKEPLAQPLKVERALSSTKEEFHMQRESLQQRQEELSHKEAQLKDSLLKFDRFLKENDSKRERAVRKGGEEKALGLSKAAEAEALRAQLGALRVEAQRLAARCQLGQPALSLLESAVGSSSSEFQDVRQLLSRYETSASDALRTWSVAAWRAAPSWRRSAPLASAVPRRLERGSLRWAGSWRGSTRRLTR
ncbi:unnamed protein product, partial [Lampetra fluviatilis]